MGFFHATPQHNDYTSSGFLITCDLERKSVSVKLVSGFSHVYKYHPTKFKRNPFINVCPQLILNILFMKSPK